MRRIGGSFTTGISILAVGAAAGLLIASGDRRALLAVIAAIPAVGLVCVLSQIKARRTGMFILCIAAATISMNNLRVTSFTTVSDVFLILAGGFIVIDWSRDWQWSTNQSRTLTAGFLILAGAVLGSTYATSLSGSLNEITRFGGSAIGVPVLFAIWRPRVDELRRLALAYVVGAAANAAASFTMVNAQGRALGFSVHPNHLAIASLLASGPAAAFAFNKAEPTQVRRLAGLCWMVLAAGIIRSGSRAAVLGAVAMILVMVILTGRVRVLRPLILMGLVGGALVKLGVVALPRFNALARLFSSDDSSIVANSNANRASRGALALSEVTHHWLTGTGFEGALEAHSLYLQVVAGAGLLGLAGILLVLFTTGQLTRFPQLRQQPLLTGLVVGWVGYLVAATVSNNLWDRYLWFHFALTMALAGCLRTPVEEPAKPGTPGVHTNASSAT